VLISNGIYGFFLARLRFFWAILEAGKSQPGADSASSAPWISRCRRAARPRNTQVLRWESFSLRRTPLPQEDRGELNQPAAGLRYPSVRRGRRVRLQIVLPSKRPITVFVLRFLFK
jgi:hypothetical protein